MKFNNAIKEGIEIVSKGDFGTSSKVFKIDGQLHSIASLKDSKKEYHNKLAIKLRDPKIFNIISKNIKALAVDDESTYDISTKLNDDIVITSDDGKQIAKIPAENKVTVPKKKSSGIKGIIDLNLSRK